MESPVNGKKGKTLYWKAVRKNSENMSAKYSFSTVQNTRMQYELYEGLHKPKRTEAAAL